MNETVQAVVVTLVALAALLILLRPIFSRHRKSSSSKAGGCSNCAEGTGSASKARVAPPHGPMPGSRP